MATIDTILSDVASLPQEDQRNLLRRLHDRITYHSDGFIQPPMVRFAALDAALCDIVGVGTLQAPCRKRAVAWARHILVYQMKVDGYSFSEIGRCLKRDHATVMSSFNQVEAMFNNPRCYSEEFRMLRKMRERTGGPQA